MLLLSMEAPSKPACYDSVPACLCTSCQLYDVHCAESSSLSTTSFLPHRYAASLLSSPVTSCAVSSVLSTRPSCSVADSTCGLSNTNVPRRRPSHVRRRFDFAVSSPPFMLPVSSAGSVAVPSSPVAVSSSPIVPPSTVAVSSSSVAILSGPVLPSQSSPVLRLPCLVLLALCLLLLSRLVLVPFLFVPVLSRLVVLLETLLRRFVYRQVHCFCLMFL